MALTANEWASQIAKQVGQAVAHYRGETRDVRGGKLTAQALADRCANLGLPMDRTVIAKLEKGTRQTITVGELLVLARALEIPPVLLLFPLGRQEKSEILPGEETDVWSALKWFTGEDEKVPGMGEGQDTGAVRLFREHERYVSEWWDQRRKVQHILDTRHLTESRTEPDPETLDSHLVRLGAEAMGRLADALAVVRNEMRNNGLKPPPLEGEIAYIEFGAHPAPAAESAPSVASIPMEPLPPGGAPDWPGRDKAPKGDQS